MAFKKRDKIVCIDDKGFELASRGEKLPILGTIYHVREVIQNGQCIRLVEFINTTRQYIDDFGEIAFKASRFIKVRSRNMATFAVRGPMPTASPTTWNPADTSTGQTLSAGNLTFTQNSASYRTTRSVAFVSSGKFYWELYADTILTAATGIVEGIANGSFALDLTYLGETGNALGWASDGNVYLNNAPIIVIQTWVQGDTLCFALDVDHGKIWFRTNGGNWNNDVIGNQNPATNTGGITYSVAGPIFAAGQGNTSGDKLTANFGATAYAQTSPAGFSNLVS